MASRRVVVVTGAASGMGLATARLLSSQGYSVVLVDLVQAAVDAAAASIVKGDGQLLALAADVSSSQAVAKLFADVTEKLGALYGVAHCAGILGTVGPVDEQAEAEQEKIVAVNFLGTVHVNVNAIKTFKAQGAPPPTGYAIVNVASFMAQQPHPGSAVYSATKGAVKSFTQSIAREHADHGIRANTVNPGRIATGMAAKLVEQRGPVLPPELCPMRRWGEGSEVAEIIAFLLSEKASYVTGSHFDVDGGKNC